MTEILIDENFFTADSAVAPSQGPVGQGDVVKRLVLREWLPLQADRISVMRDAGVPARTVTSLDMNFYTGNPDGTFQHGLNDAGHVEYSQMGTSNYTVTLQKGQGAILWLDTAKMRGETWEDMQRQINTVAQGMADSMDKNMLSTLYAGAGETVAAAAKWDAGTPDVLDDVLGLRDQIAEQARGTMGIGPLSFVTHISTRKALERLQWIANANQNLRNILANEYDVRTFYTNDSPTINTNGAALLFRPGGGTAEMLRYRGPGLVPIESGRLRGRGEEWFVTDFFTTVIHQLQDGASAGKNELIGTLTSQIN